MSPRKTKQELGDVLRTLLNRETYCPFHERWTPVVYTGQNSWTMTCCKDVVPAEMTRAKKEAIT
jgi:hypothetical protein